MATEKETIHVVERRNAIWVNIFREERSAVIVEEREQIFEGVQVGLDDIAGLISALEEAAEILRDSEDVCPTE